jgi:hypothetical protein
MPMEIDVVKSPLDQFPIMDFAVIDVLNTAGGNELITSSDFGAGNFGCPPSGIG